MVTRIPGLLKVDFVGRRATNYGVNIYFLTVLRLDIWYLGSWRKCPNKLSLLSFVFAIFFSCLDLLFSIFPEVLRMHVERSWKRIFARKTTDPKYFYTMHLVWQVWDVSPWMSWTNKMWFALISSNHMWCALSPAVWEAVPAALMKWDIG